jgi:RimJ/RimL family protein N-acetyltransferase
MAATFQNLKSEEWILLHDFYFDSPEPDAPKNKFENLDEHQKKLAAEQYNSDHFKSVWIADALIGFVGFFPDDDDNINLFYVVSPPQRGKGYFSLILKSSLDYCRQHFADYKYMRALTRKENKASTKALERFSFTRNRSVTEEVQPDISYEEYLLPISLQANRI